MPAIPRQWMTDDVPDNLAILEGDITRGRLLFKKKCSQCHSIRQDGRTSAGCAPIGPNLYGVIGRTAGAVQEATVRGISSALHTSGIVWTDASLMRYLRNPSLFVASPINMNFYPMESWDDRVDLICYIKVASKIRNV